MLQLVQRVPCSTISPFIPAWNIIIIISSAVSSSFGGPHHHSTLPALPHRYFVPRYITSCTGSAQKAQRHNQPDHNTAQLRTAISHTGLHSD